MTKKNKYLTAQEVVMLTTANVQTDRYFEEVYKAYFDRLFAYALVITKSDSLAKDVISDVFCGLWNSRKDLHTVRELKSYLYTSVKHEAIRAVSRDFSRFKSENYSLLLSTVDGLDPQELFLGKELTEFVEKTTSKLPPLCGMVYKMVRENNMSYQEVARELGISNDTVKHHLKTALKKIKSELEIHFGDSRVIKLSFKKSTH